MSKLQILAVTNSHKNLKFINQNLSVTNLTLLDCCLRFLNYPTGLKFEDYQCFHLKEFILIEFRCKKVKLSLLIMKDK